MSDLTLLSDLTYTPTLEAPERDVAEGTPPLRPVGTRTVRIGSTLGIGGNGRVVTGFQPGLDRTVAVKQVNDPSDQRAIQTLLDEARITARLTHPCIVPIFELHRAPSESPAVVMQVGVGIPWYDHARQQRHGPEDAVRIAILLAQTLEYAHSQRVLHLDIKPTNVLLGDYGETYLIDWGVALDRTREPERTTVRGTPAFMAPEMCDPSIGRITERADVYLLAGTLYSIITGCPPFPFVRTVDERDPRAPAELPELERVPNELAELITEALAPSPQRRPSMLTFRRSLQSFLHHEDARRLLESAKTELNVARSTQQLDAVLSRVLSVRELWPTSPGAIQMQAEVLRDLVSAHLDDGNLPAARRALAGIAIAERAEGDIILLATLETKERQFADTRREMQWRIENLRPEMSARNRMLMVPLVALLFAIQILAWYLRDDEQFLSAEALLAFAGGLGVIWTATLVAGQRVVFHSYASKVVFHTVSFCLIAIFLNRTAGYWNNWEPQQILQSDLILMTMVVATRVQIHQTFRLQTAIMVSATVGTILFPDSLAYMVTLAPALVLMSVYLFWDVSELASSSP